MRKQLISASAYSMASYTTTQVLRFVGNLVLAKLLSPGAFGIVAVVNMLILAMNLLCDVGISKIVIQRQGDLSREWLNTIWTVQIARGFIVWALAVISAVVMRVLQTYRLVDKSTAYADPALPFLIIGAASAAIFQGFESTKSITQRRELALGRITAMGFIAQGASLGLMVIIARATKSPWALVAGGVASAMLQCLISHLWLPGENNRYYFNKSIALEIIKKGRWVMVSSFVMFLGGNADIITLGGVADKVALGNYVIAFQLANVVQLLANTFSGNVVFPALSAMRRNGPSAVERGYTKLQIASDSLIVTAAGIFATAGGAIVYLLFDQRYAQAGSVLSCLSIGIVGMRYYVIEQQINADGNFRLTTIVSALRLACMACGTYIGFRIDGLTGAAIAVGISALSGWPIFIWYRAKHIGFRWYVEAAALGYFVIGCGGGIVLSKLIHLYR